MERHPSNPTALDIIKQFRLIVLAAVSTLVVGTIFYRIVEDWSWIDSLYFCTVSLTTVGYGDLTPTTDFGKLFTIFYLIIGISIVAALINNLVKHAVTKRELKQRDKE